jgi:hypothetical protein
MFPATATDALQNLPASSVSSNGFVQGSTINWTGASQGFSYAANNSGRRSYMPQNHWIGPGDSLRLNWNEGGLKAANYGFTFVTVTES